MSAELVARFEKRYPRGAVVSGELRQPARGFSITVLLGPSGCGKTTLLRCLAGLERPEAGAIRFDGDTWFDADRRLFRSPQRRGIGFLFQEYALFPHLTVAGNIGYGLHGASREERRRALQAVLARFHLAGLQDRYPHQISGGQQQRVALARVLARRPRLLLLDEPLSALDATLRDELRAQLRRLLSEFAIPVILVTHDRAEAIALGDSVVVMESGVVLQQGSVDDIFSRPRDLNVARIAGIETIESGKVVRLTGGLATIDVAGVPIVAPAPVQHGRGVHVCIKGEDVIVDRGEPGGTMDSNGSSPVVKGGNQVPAVVKWIMPEGPLVRVGLDCGFELVSLTSRTDCEELQLRVGERVTATVKASAIHLIPNPPSPGVVR